MSAGRLDNPSTHACPTWPRVSFALACGLLCAALLVPDVAAQTNQQPQPDLREAYYNWGKTLGDLARLLQQQGQLDAAQQRFLEAAEKYAGAVQIKPDDEAYYNWGKTLADLARLLQQQGQLGAAQQRFLEAGEKYAAALQIKPDDETYYNNWGTALADLGRLLQQQGQVDAAQQRFREAGEKYAAAVQLKKALPAKATIIPSANPDAPRNPPMASVGPEEWSPPNIDLNVPPVSRDVTCQLPQVLASASARVRELVTNLQEFTATERIEKREVEANGKVKVRIARSFSYLVSIREIRPNWFAVDEDRSNGEWPQNIKDSDLLRYETSGLVALALIFHPAYVGNYAMHCEGLGTWHDRPAWLVHFAQREDRPNRIRSFSIRQGHFEIKLKGRAWIAADTGQILRLETDLIEPLPAIRLAREHLVVDYGPVKFRARNIELWLPHAADLYMDFRGRRYHHSYSYNDFLLFFVEAHVQIRSPVQNPQQPQP